MRANNVLGLIFSNTYDNYLSEITSVRSMGSVPYGCRYRLIDFQLSAMVNSGVTHGSRRTRQSMGSFP